MSIERIHLIILSSGDYESVFSGLYCAAALAASRKVVVFAHMQATRALLADPTLGWTQLESNAGKSPRDLDHLREAKGINGIETLRSAAVKSGVRFFTSTIGLTLISAKREALDPALKAEVSTLADVIKQFPQAQLMNF